MNSPGARWRPVYIGIGSNLDSPKEQVAKAIDELRALPNCVITGVSSLYLSAPVGPSDQPDFINAVAAMLTRISAHELLSALQDIEVAHNRDRSGRRWGPRTLDLDLLVYSTQVIADNILSVPHPRIRERNFVLLPLCELAPHLIVPGSGSVTEMARAISSSNVRIEKISAISP